jgi:RNA polymerase sigma-70 factor (ECF subfamily)
MLRYARALIRDPGEAEDLVQDAVVRALQSWGSYRGEASRATWLHRILHNVAVDRARRRREDVVDVCEQAAGRTESLWQDETYTIDAATVTERAEARRELQDALLRLPLIYRSAVILHDSEGLTVPQIADIQRVGLAAAKQRLRRGRMMLVSDLAEGPHDRQDQGVPMRCWDARSKISDYLDADLGGRDRILLEHHLAKCPTCPPLYAGLVGVKAALGARRDPDDVIPARIQDRIRGGG